MAYTHPRTPEDAGGVSLYLLRWFRSAAVVPLVLLSTGVIAHGQTLTFRNPRDLAAYAELPFELYQHHLIVTRGSIGPLNGLRLLIDTGAIPSVVDDRIARKLHLRAEPSVLVAFGRQVQVRSAVVDGIRVGSLQTGTIPVRVGDLSYLAGIRVDAVVGLDVLARTTFSIDYGARVLTFADRGEALIAPMEIAWPFITVRLMIAGEQVRLLIDTGSRDLVLFKARMPAALSDLPWKGDKTVQYASGPARLVRLELRRVGLGAQTWDKLEAWSPDRSLDGYPPEVDGVLGVLALGCKRVRFDFERGELGCKRVRFDFERGELGCSR